MGWEFGISRCKLLYIEWINNKVLQYSTGNYIQYPVINHNGKEYGEEGWPLGPLRQRQLRAPWLQEEAVPRPGPGLCCKPGGGPDRSDSFVHHIRRSQLALCCTAPRTATAPSLAWPPVTPAQLPGGMTTTGG